MSSTPGPSRGLPILSGPPPITESDKCRQCDKEFNIVWRRSHACGHCGFEYCSTCISDGQALMPRRPGQETKGKGPFAELKAGLGLDDRSSSSSSSGSGYGYEVENVCVPCLGMLQVTCAPVQSLRNLPLKRLKEYLAAYNIPNVGPKEKEDFVQAIIKARNPRTGALSPEAENETYYRRHSVPKKSGVNGNGATARPTPGQGPGPSRPQHAQARPPPPQANNNYNRPPPPQSSYRPPPPTGQYRPPPGNYYRPPPTPPQFQHLPQARANPTPTRTPAHTAAAPAPAKAKTPPPPVPTIMGLVALPNSYLSTLSIGTLKAILYENHVKVDFKQVLEKQELIGRVAELISAERKRLERQRYEEERLAQGESTASAAAVGEDTHAGVTDKAQVPTGPMPEIERGLCVVCQDEEATLAVVDCGHLAMCQHCSELIMATSQECPLCRTRIITSQRLIRIYRV